MKNQLLILALFATAVCFVSAEDAVLDLNASNFDEVVNANSLILVEFYAPWCGHCKKLAPEYEKAAQELKGTIALAKVNADEEVNKPLASRFGIRGFPTLKVFRNGVPTDYQGERTAQTIVSYMKKQSRPAVSALNTKAELDAFVNEDKVVVIGVFAERSGSEYEAFKVVAESLRNNFLFGELVGNNDVAKEIGADSTPNVVLFKKFDEGKNILGSDFSDLASFINKNSMPLIDEIGPENYKNYAESGLPLAYLFVDVSNKDAPVNELKEVAKATKGKINFVYIDNGKYAKHAEKLGLSGKVVPSFVIEEPESGKHFVFDETTAVSSDAVSAFVNQYLEGKLQPTIKSEEIPVPNDAPVTILVAKNFDQIVLDTTKDVLVEFYAPWCGHCKKLTPIYEQLGETYKSVDSVVIAKIDATANDVDGKYGIRGFPTIKLFPANNKATPIEYNGDRSHDDLAKFINQNASVKFEQSGQDKDEL